MLNICICYLTFSCACRRAAARSRSNRRPALGDSKCLWGLLIGPWNANAKEWLMCSHKARLCDLHSANRGIEEWMKKKKAGLVSMASEERKERKCGKQELKLGVMLGYRSREVIRWWKMMVLFLRRPFVRRRGDSPQCNNSFISEWDKRLGDYRVHCRFHLFKQLTEWVVLIIHCNSHG